jgi:N-acetylmuramoyl-L-alanine amidase CwlA
MKKNLFLVILFFAFALVACGEKVDPTISVDKDDVSIEVGKTESINIKALNTEEAITVTSADDSIATIQDGVISAVGVGETTLTITCGSLTKTIKVTVTPEPAETFTVKFLNSDYSLIEAQTVEKGKDATPPTVDSTEEKKFIGWSKPYTNITANVTCVAMYQDKYTVTYNVAGGVMEGEGTTSYFAGDTFDLPLAHKSGCKFMGWEDSENPGDLIDKLPSDATGNKLFTAKYAEVSKFNVEYDFVNGISSELYLASKEVAVATWYIDNYNAVKGSYWGGAYANYSFITNKSNDPGATFSDRFYIAVDSETGLYKVVSILLSGASSWPNGAQYVITFSSSYKNHNAFHNEAVKVEVGDYVVFDGDFTQIKKTGSPESVNVYFFREDPTVSVVNKVVNSETDQLIAPVRLGYKFLYWADDYGLKVTSINQLYNNAKLKAVWEERTPVTDISTNDVPTELRTGETFKINAKVVPSDAYFQTVSFSTSNRDIIDVDQNGNLTAKSAGTCQITMVDYMKRVTNEKTITVYSIDSIDLNTGNFTGVMAVNDTFKLEPIAVGKNVDNVTFTFTSLTPNIVSVDANGNIKALAVGSGNIQIKDSANHTLEFGVTVASFDENSKVDQLLKLLAENNMATVQAGNVSLYDDGTEKYYKATYGSVNYFYFAKFEINRSNANGVANPNGSPMTRRFDATHDDSIQYVTVHDTATLTGNANSTAASMNNSGTNSSATIHYVVGSGGIYQAVTEDFIAYHAGDGTGNKIEYYNTGVKAPTTGSQYPTYGIKKTDNGYIYTINGQDTTISVPNTGGTPKLTHLGPIWKIVDGYYYIGKTWHSSGYGYVGSYGGNNNSIGIEMCVNIGGDIYDTWQRNAQLVADICVRNNLDITRVKMHNTWTGKNCPQCLIAGHYWWNFIKMVQANMTIMTEYKDATISVTSNNPNIVNNDGRIVNAPATTTKVSYTVTVSIGTETKSMTFYNIVPGTTTWEQWNGSYASSKIWNNGRFSSNDIVDLPYID